MEITLNNRKEIFEGHDSLTVEQILELKSFTFRLLVIKINDTLVPKDKYQETIVYDGDHLTVLHLISGG